MRKIPKYKMTPQELEIWLKLRKKCGAMRKKKGKGSYNRQKFKKIED